EAPGSPQTRPCSAQPPHRAIPDDTSDNYRSVGLRLSFGGFDFLDLGDLTWNVEHKLACPQNLVGVSDVCPVTHRGKTKRNNAAPPDHTAEYYLTVLLRRSFGGFDLLDLGDLTWNVEHKLACPQNLVGVIDVYQVTHHGNDNSNNPALVAALAPTVAVIDNGAKKGGTPAAYKVLRATPSIKDVFQLHRHVATTPAENPPPELTANDDEACAGEWIRLRVDPRATSYT